MFVLCFQSYLRVSQKLHTVSQVVVGAVVGSMFSILWYWLWNAFVLDAFVSSLWVRIIVVLVSAVFCLGFLLHVVHHWLKDEWNLITMCYIVNIVPCCKCKNVGYFIVDHCKVESWQNIFSSIFHYECLDINWVLNYCMRDANSTYHFFSAMLFYPELEKWASIVLKSSIITYLHLTLSCMIILQRICKFILHISYNM